jgi:hypothetical protein
VRLFPRWHCRLNEPNECSGGNRDNQFPAIDFEKPDAYFAAIIGDYWADYLFGVNNDDHAATPEAD